VQLSTAHLQQGRLVLDVDGKTVEFAPLDQDELDDAVIAADEA